MWYLYSLTKGQDAIPALAALVWVSLIASVGSLSATRANAQNEEDFFHLGVVEYEISCLPCHGDDGQGDGPQAEFLDTQPVLS
jgi:hypothetical protein